MRSLRLHMRYSFAGRFVKASVLLCVLCSIAFSQGDYWQNLNGPVGGMVGGFAFPASGDILLTCSSESATAMYRSSNNGDSWTSMASPPGAVFLGSIAINSSGHLFVGALYSVWRSTDNGGSWMMTSCPGGGQGALKINSSGHIFAGSSYNYEGMFRSTDNGDTWTSISAGLPDSVLITSLDIDPSTGVLFAGSDKGVCRSTNNGDSWVQINSGLGNQHVPYSSLIVRASGALYVGTGDSLFRSTNTGDSWSGVGMGVPNPQITRIASNSSGHLFVDVAHRGLYRSTDEGATWTLVYASPGGWYGNDAVGVSPLGHVFYQTFGGIHRSTSSGDTWTRINTGLNANIVLSLAAQRSGIGYAGTYYAGVFRTTDNGDSWAQTNLKDVEYMFALALDSVGVVYASSIWGPLYRSSDSGASWTSKYSPSSGYGCNALATNASGDIFAGNNAGILVRSTDGGTTWTLLTTGLPGAAIGCLMVMGGSGPPAVMYAGTGNGLYRSTDNGDSWTASGLANRSVMSFVQSPIGHFFAGTEVGVFRSTDNGSTWTAVNSGASGEYIISLAVNSLGHVFRSDGGVPDRSTDNGDTWLPVKSGSDTRIQSLAMGAGDYLLAGSLGHGVYRSSQSTLVAYPPTSPSLVSPTDGTVGIPAAPDIRVTWQKTDRATVYNVQVATDSLFTNLVVDDPSVSDTMRILPGLQPLTTYFWRVSGANVGGMGAFSSIWKFRTLGFPTQVQLVSPANAATNQPVNISYRWKRAFDQTRPITPVSSKSVKDGDRGDLLLSISTYWFEQAADTVTLANLVRDTTLTDTTRSATLANLTTYYWRVRAKNETGWGGFSPWWRFTTIIAAPALPVHVSPADTSVGNLTTLTLRWRAGLRASSYRLQVATDTAFTALVMHDSTVTDTARVVAGLQSLTTFYWRVSASNVGGSSGFTSRWRFRTLGVPFPVSLVSPPDNATNQPTTLTFRWRRGADQLFGPLHGESESDAPTTVFRYWYERVSDTLTNANLNRDTLLTDTSKAVTGLATTTTHFWRVRARNEIGWGSFGAWFRFTTTTTGVADDGGIPTEFSLNQNYPNPFNPSTTIEFGLPVGSSVRLEIYNLVGQRVQQLVNTDLPAGYHVIQWNGTGDNGEILASGVYFYRIMARGANGASYSSTHKLVLMK